MALTAKRKAELAKMSVPSDAETQRRIRSFMLRSGLNWVEFSDLIGYGYSSLGLFMRGKYNSHHPSSDNTLALRAAAKELMDLHEISERFTFRGKQHMTKTFHDVRASALNALNLGTAYVVDGPPGTEKTYSLRRIEQEINETGIGRAVYVYARVDHSPQSFLIECCTAAGIPNRGHIDGLIRKLRFFLGTGRTLFMVDEAQHLDTKGLEVLRQLLDLPPFFGIVLAGSHDLTQRLSHWQMEQWRSRLRKTHLLNGPSKAEAREILRDELGSMSDAECDSFIADCMATGYRTQVVGGKAVNKSFEYISARDLFSAIESIQQRLIATTPNEGAA